MHNQFILNEVETVRFCLPRTIYHILNLLLWKLWQLVYRLQWIQRVGNAERNLELVWLDKFVSEIMAFDHHETLDWLWADLELECCAQCLQLEKHRTEVVLDGTGLFRDWHAPILLFLPDFKQRLSWCILLVYVPDFKIHEFNLVSVGLCTTKISLSWRLEVPHLLYRYVGVHLSIFKIVD